MFQAQLRETLLQLCFKKFVKRDIGIKAQLYPRLEFS